MASFNRSPLQMSLLGEKSPAPSKLHRPILVHLSCSQHSLLPSLLPAIEGPFAHSSVVCPLSGHKPHGDRVLARLLTTEPQLRAQCLAHMGPRGTALSTRHVPGTVRPAITQLILKMRQAGARPGMVGPKLNQSLDL